MCKLLKHKDYLKLMEIFNTRGTCSRQIIFDVKDDTLKNCRFVNGCSGNTQALIKLTDGRPIDEIIERLSGIKCKQGTSCPDQLAKALIAYKEKLVAKQEKDQQKKAAQQAKVIEAESAATIDS